VQLLVFRVGLITFVLAVTLAVNLGNTEELVRPSTLWLFGLIGLTYLLSLAYALWLRPGGLPRRLLLVQTAGDLTITTALVHVTGGVQSGYSFFYLLSIVATAMISDRRGTLRSGAASILLFGAISLLGYYRVLPAPSGLKLLPWDLPVDSLVRQLALSATAFAAVTFLASKLGEQLASAGERLDAEEARTADLAAQSADVIRCLTSGLVTVGRDRRVITFNEAAAEILGVAPAQARGRIIDTVVPELGALLERLGDGRDLRREELHFRRGDQTRALGVSVSLLTNRRNESIGRIVNFQDLTELRRMETEVKRGEHLAAIGQMAAGVAHEIRNPLASISGSIELLRGAPQIDADDRALMDIVLREVDRLNRLITDLLDYARPRERVPVTFDLAALLDETVRVFAQDRSAGVAVSYVPDAMAPGELRVHADPAQVRQVVWNLLRNAAEAMGPGGGGAITVTSRHQTAPDGAPLAEFSVADTGSGIAPGDLDRVFEPFFTTKTRGSGLGLATVHRIVHEHGGAIHVDSAAGSGTCMIVRLPQVTGPRAASPPAYTEPRGEPSP
jgi:two-component system sensor histidine kinase PilS (NtrC family)